MPHAAHILVVDDDEAICDIVASVLEEEGYRVDCVFTARGAHAALESERFDLALIDVLTRGDHGYELALHAASKGAAVLLMSGHPEVIKRELGTKFSFIAKPFGIADLRRRVELALTSRSAPDRGGGGVRKRRDKMGQWDKDRRGSNRINRDLFA